MIVVVAIIVIVAATTVACALFLPQKNSTRQMMRIAKDNIFYNSAPRLQQGIQYLIDIGNNTLLQSWS